MGDADWSTNGTDAFEIKLRYRSGSEDVFQPPFTYPIFGDEETIFGYKDLTIKLEFEADTLSPTCKIDYTAKYPAHGETMADNVEEILKPFIPAVYEPASDEIRDVLDHQPFTPPGAQIRCYSANNRKFGVWVANLLEPQVKEMVRRVQVLVPLFIEGGTELVLDHPNWTIQRWNVFFLYEIIESSAETSTTSYNLAGYCTTYCLQYLHSPENTSSSAPSDFTAPDSLPNILPQRQRISQFLILPPFRSGGHGSRMYSTIFKHYHDDIHVHEITVEDPNELFDDMRDVNDLIWLRSENSLQFKDIKINPNVAIISRVDVFPSNSVLDMGLVNRVHMRSKMADRQFDRLLEMNLLSHIPAEKRFPSRLARKEKASDENDRRYYFWRTLVKRRLYKHNRDTLIQFSAEERVEKLEQTIAAVQDDYVRLLSLTTRREEQMTHERAELLNGQERRKNVKKRVVDDEDEDVDSPASKRARAD